MKRTLTAIFCVWMLLLCLAGCKRSPEPENPETVKDDPYDIMGEDPYGIRNEGGFNVFYSRKVANEMLDDGWVFTFAHNFDKIGDRNDIMRYQFYGINLRYRYDEDFVIFRTDMYGDKELHFREIPPIMIWGDGSDVQRRDVERVSQVLDYDKEPEDLLALDPADFEFEALDKDLFFRLLHAALEGEPHKEGTVLSYWEKPSYAFFGEPGFLDGYKFQVAFITAVGYVDELFIDVLYPTGPGYADYIQLSDLVENGTATPEQVELFGLLRSITEQVKSENSFIAGADGYRNTVMDGVELSRLYTFMNNIHENNYGAYLESPILERID